MHERDEKMHQVRTGWEDLLIAQALWAKILARDQGCQLSFAPANAQSVGLIPENAAELPAGLRDELWLLANRTEMVARCTCDVCGKHAFAGSRCAQHRDTPVSIDSVKIDDIWNATDDPMVELERIAANCVDMVLIGPTECVLDMMDREDRLYAAVCTRNELAGVDDPCGERAAQLVMQADRRHTRRARDRLRNADGRTKYHPLWGVEEDAFWCQGTSEVYAMLVKKPALEAIARTCVRYREKALGRNLRGALAMLDADSASSAIASIG